MPWNLREHYDMVEEVIEYREKKFVDVSMRIMSFPAQLHEHMDALSKIGQNQRRLKWIPLKQEVVIDGLRRVKNGKQPAPDNIKDKIQLN